MLERIAAFLRGVFRVFSSQEPGQEPLGRGELLNLVRDKAPGMFSGQFDAEQLRGKLLLEGVPESELSLPRISSLLRTIADEGRLEVVSKGVGRRLAVYRPIGSAVATFTFPPKVFNAETDIAD